jgi:hypothetical protein
MTTSDQTDELWTNALVRINLGQGGLARRLFSCGNDAERRILLSLSRLAIGNSSYLSRPGRQRQLLISPSCSS